jgi:hypothetical protein
LRRVISVQAINFPRISQIRRNHNLLKSPNFFFSQPLRDALFNELTTDPPTCWHRPIVVRDMTKRLGDVIGQMTVVPEHPGDDVIEHDLILVWGAQKRIITGADLLGRLLRGIAKVVPAQPEDR